MWAAALNMSTQLNYIQLCLRVGCRLQRRFKSPRIAAMLSFQDLYVGLSPYSAPGTCTCDKHMPLSAAVDLGAAGPYA